MRQASLKAQYVRGSGQTILPAGISILYFSQRAKLTLLNFKLSERCHHSTPVCKTGLKEVQAHEACEPQPVFGMHLSKNQACQDKCPGNRTQCAVDRPHLKHLHSIKQIYELLNAITLQDSCQGKTSASARAGRYSTCTFISPENSILPDGL